MKTLSLLTVLALCGAVSAPVLAANEPGDEVKGCAAKQQAISKELDQAKAQGNTDQQSGLATALKESKANCTDSGLQKERENKVLSARHDVAKRQADLDKAVKKGDADKINTRKDKLAESRKELQQAIDQLDK